MTIQLNLQVGPLWHNWHTLIWIAFLVVVSYRGARVARLRSPVIARAKPETVTPYETGGRTLLVGVRQ